MLKENLLYNYQIFFDLRNRYPKHCKLISEIMKYAFEHKDSFDEHTYLKGTFDENSIKFIFEKLNLHLIVLNVINATLRSNHYTIVQLSIKDEMLAC